MEERNALLVKLTELFNGFADMPPHVRRLMLPALEAVTARLVKGECCESLHFVCSNFLGHCQALACHRCRNEQRDLHLAAEALRAMRVNVGLQPHFQRTAAHDPL